MKPIFVDHRVLAAVRFEDAVTRVPLEAAVRIRSLGAERVDFATPTPTVTPIAFRPDAIRFLRNRSGLHVLIAAPLFDDYVNAFDNPSRPDGFTAHQVVRLRLLITDAGPHHLPRRFRIDLPLSIDPIAVDNVFEPVAIALLPAPQAPVSRNWGLLRVTVTRRAADDPATPRLPGVLIQARRNSDGTLLGQGMTEWRHRGFPDLPVRGEALVALRGIPRFVPGDGAQPLTRGEEIRLEAIRSTQFSGAEDDAPDVESLELRAGDGVTVATGALLTTRPVMPRLILAGEELTLALAMP